MRISPLRVMEAALLSMVQLTCPDCEYQAPIIEMAEHYKKTGHGKRSKP